MAVLLHLGLAWYSTAISQCLFSLACGFCVPAAAELWYLGRHTQEAMLRNLQYWQRFPQIGVVQKTPESITSATLKEIHCPHLSQQVESKLPPIYKIREKQAANKSFPFSLHDNRHSFENSGYYFDSGLGRKKISPDKRQHISRNFNLWACDFIPSHFDGLSNNRTSYVHKEAVVISTFRRFPRCYNEKWSAFKFIHNPNASKFLKTQPNEEFSVDTKALSPQEP